MEGRVVKRRKAEFKRWKVRAGDGMKAELQKRCKEANASRHIVVSRNKQSRANKIDSDVLQAKGSLLLIEPG